MRRSLSESLCNKNKSECPDLLKCCSSGPRFIASVEYSCESSCISFEMKSPNVIAILFLTLCFIFTSVSMLIFFTRKLNFLKLSRYPYNNPNLVENTTVASAIKAHSEYALTEVAVKTKEHSNNTNSKIFTNTTFTNLTTTTQ